MSNPGKKSDKIPDKKADILFEVSYEVCNKVGGIYTVVMSKANVAKKFYSPEQVQSKEKLSELKHSSSKITDQKNKSNSDKDSIPDKNNISHKNNSNSDNNNHNGTNGDSLSYVLVGPYYYEKAIGEFQEDVPSEKLKAVFDELKQQGINCHYGSWLIKGEPNVILIDFKNFYPNLNNIKKELWDNFKIDTLNCPGDVNEPLVWSYASGLLIEKLSKIHPEKKVVAQFHEWLSGAGLLHVEQQKKSGNLTNIGTVFTTHATILGRAIAANPNIDLYSTLDSTDAEKEAYNYGIAAKFQIEKQSALNATVFTTVSEITGVEAEKLLTRKPDVLLPNGLDMDEFPSFEEASIQHKDLKFKMKEYVLFHFFPSYSFDIDNTLIFFTFARYEFKNKGLDIFIEALAKLNENLKKENINKSVIAFFFIPTGIIDIHPQLVANKRYYEDIKDAVDSNRFEMRNNVLINILSKQQLRKEEIFSQDFLSAIKRKMLRFSVDSAPLLCSHELKDEHNDAILNHFKQFGLLNKKEDPVKVILYPTYLSGADGLMDLDYYQAIQAGHLGVFPSSYEPWGYTPLEAGALGVASVTTDLAGFGRYINSQRPKEVCNATTCNPVMEKGMYIVRRSNKKGTELVNELYEVFNYYSHLSKQERIDNKIEARRLASLADWKNLFKFYIEAHNKAIQGVK